MEKKMNPWDTLSSLFTGETSVDGIPEGAADNVLIPRNAREKV